MAEEGSWLTRMEGGLCPLCAVVLLSLEADDAFPLAAAQPLTSDLPNLALFPFQTDKQIMSGRAENRDVLTAR